ncbi:hypothetical protein Q4512_07835 [Oceanihabitans sp. 2_MG-2023]|uniref:DUF6799 domain-containing protein n=1 Tax=Oceanihabitans sp. 2_MG-2023 TaxID=3062661 RepID=UPI0026E22CB3|nr:DUF6799 domain-containing protein [Oceanihabitans sp. 2_MG-2023]MDO6596823.1 hypothetical protein [Oceanihabitans sp. 2_MG-2023]
MKNIYLLFLLAFFTTGSFFAQDKTEIEDANFCISIDGKVFKNQNGKIDLLEKIFKLNNGTIVYPNGSYRLTNEEKFFLKEGECIGFSGKIYESQDALNVALYKKFKKHRK